MTKTIYYVADPMCSWCWGFARDLGALRFRLSADVSYRLVMGGLAPDSDEAMPEATQQYVQAAWDEVEARTGAQFNRDFWTQCEPRRSTWPACRAVLAAATIAADGAGEAHADAMFDAIQRAYYLDAQNPSDDATLLALAKKLELDLAAFEAELHSPSNHDQLARDFALRDQLEVSGFPTLVYVDGDTAHTVMRGHAAIEDVLVRLTAIDETILVAG